MPAFADLFPNLAKLKKDGPSEPTTLKKDGPSEPTTLKKEGPSEPTKLNEDVRSEPSVNEREVAAVTESAPSASEFPAGGGETPRPSRPDVEQPPLRPDVEQPSADTDISTPVSPIDVERRSGASEVRAEPAPIPMEPWRRPARQVGLKVGGPTRARRDRRGEDVEDERPVVHEWVAPVLTESVAGIDAEVPAADATAERAPEASFDSRSSEGEAAEPAAAAAAAAPGAVDAGLAPLAPMAPAAVEPVHGAATPVEHERRTHAERRSGREERDGRERRFGADSRSSGDRRDGEDPRSGEDQRSGTNRRKSDPEPVRPTAAQGSEMRAQSRQARGPLEAAVLGIADRLSGGRGGSGEPRRAKARKQRGASQETESTSETVVAGDVEAPSGSAVAPLSAPARSKRRRVAGGGAPSLKGLGNLGSLKKANVSLNRGGRTPSLVGLDIQPGYVTAVDADVNGIVAVKRAVGLALPADTMREGEVIDAALLSEALRDLFAKGGLSKRVRIGLANQRTVVRTMELPPIEDHKELAAAVSFQAQDQIPMPLASAVLDFQPLGIVQTPAGRRQRVVVVAAQREMVERLLGAVSAAGLRPEAVDLSAFAMIRALYRPDDAEERAGAGDAGPEAVAGLGAEAGADPLRSARTLFLNVGGLTNLAIADGATCRFTRAVGGGLESMASGLAERRSIPLVDARTAIAAFDLTKREPRIPGMGTTPGAGTPGGVPGGQPGAEVPGGVPGAGVPGWVPGAEVPGVGERPRGSVEDEAPAAEPTAAAGEIRAVIAGGIREIAGEVRNSLDFHRAQESGGVDRVVVSGAALEINGFASALEAELGFRVERRSVASSRGGELNGMPAERLAVAAGLAVEEVAR